MSWAVVAYVLVAVSADVRRGLVRGAVVVTQLVAHETPGRGSFAPGLLRLPPLT